MMSSETLLTFPIILFSILLAEPFLVTKMLIETRNRPEAIIIIKGVYIPFLTFTSILLFACSFIVYIQTSFSLALVYLDLAYYIFSVTLYFLFPMLTYFAYRLYRDFVWGNQQI